jgi:pimeloyl-ACP methyl ester carboxylesterase
VNSRINSEAPDRARGPYGSAITATAPRFNAESPFAYTFDHLAEIIEGFVDRIGLHRFVLYMFDFGAPVGFRLATRHPERIAGLVVQNANAYQEGLSPAARDFIALRPHMPGAEKQIRDLLTLDGTRTQYLTGAADPDLIVPDDWTLDQHVLDLPGHKQLHVDLAFDYHTNLALYPTWQEWLRRHQPPTLITWGTGDPFFTAAGARVDLTDVPDADLHLFDTGHFALEEKLPRSPP